MQSKVSTTAVAVRDVTVSEDRLTEIVDDLNALISYVISGGEWERHVDPALFTAYAKGTPEVDQARTVDPEGEIWLRDGTRLVFAPIMPGFPAWGMSWETDETPVGGAR